MVSLMVSGQSSYNTQMTYKKGIKIGENGTVHDSLKLESGVPHMYFGATDIPLANEDTTIQLRIEIDNATDTSNIQTTKINTNIQSASDNSDSVTIHRTELDSLRSKSNADDLRISILEGADVTAPVVDSAFIQTGNDSVIWVQFDETLGQAGNDSVTNAFSWTYGTENGSTDSVVISGVFAVIYSSINIPGDSVVYMSYNKPVTLGVHDPSYNYTADFSNKLVFNGTSIAEYEAFAFWKFNSNLNDTYGNYDGVAVNTITFTSDTAIIFSEADGNDAVNVGDILSADHTLWMWLYLDEDANESYYIWANRDSDTDDGFTFFADGNGAGTFNLNYRVGNGVSGTFAFDNGGDFAVDTWHHVAVLVDRDGNATDAYASIYIDGVIANDNDSVLQNFSDDFAVSGADNIIGARDPGSEKDGLREGAIIGEFGLDNVLWTQAQIDSSFAIGGDRLWFVDATPTPESYDTSYVIYELIDFTDLPLGPWTSESMDTIFTGTVVEASATEGTIAELLGDTCWRVDIPPINNVAGKQIRAMLPTTYSEGWFSFNFYLPADFVWSVGGKLPGIAVTERGASNDVVAGGVVAPGCDPGDDLEYTATEGSSARTAIIDPSDFGVYLYHHGMTFKSSCRTTYGDDLSSDNSWALQTWHNLTVRVIINTIDTEGNGNADGILEIYKDGVCGFIKTDIIYRQYSDMFFDQYFWSLFFGGPSDPSRTNSTSVYFDDAVWWTWADGHPYAVGQNANPVGTTLTPPNLNSK